MNHKYDSYRANQEEGRNTYSGYRHSQHMIYLHILNVIILFVVIVSFGILVQSHVDNISFSAQMHDDITGFTNQPKPQFSDCDLNHDCKHKTNTTKKIIKHAF